MRYKILYVMVFVMILISLNVKALTVNETFDLSATDTGNWIGITTLTSVSAFNSSAIYIGGSSGKFGVYNPETNVTFDLSATDTEDWIGTTQINAIDAYNTSAVYMAFNFIDGKFGVYNSQTNITTNLSRGSCINTHATAIDAFNASAVYIAMDSANLCVFNPQTNITTLLTPTPLTNTLYSVLAINSSRVYLGGDVGRYGYYDTENNNLVALTATDTDNWVGESVARSIYAYNTSTILIGFDGGKFGVYDSQTNITSTLNSSESQAWFETASPRIVRPVNNTRDGNNSQIYIGLTNGKFGVYNASSNLTFNLTATILNNWIGSTAINSVSAHNSTSYYLALDSGKFGVYTSGFTTSISTSNTTPSLTINTPSNNSQTHNATPYINFSIGTFSPNLNFSFELYIGKTGLSTNTKINRSENFTSGNFTIDFYTLNNVTEGSLNGTYNLTINLTDNASNNIIQFIVFNLTNNISNYNATNVTITTLPLEIGAIATGHCNITSFSSEKNNQSLTERLWWVNKTLIPNINSTTLAGTNTTNNANITFSCRVNNGYGETAWTVFVNSSTATVGDTTAPVITGQAINGNSFTTDQRVNVTANCTDNSAVNYVRVEWNRTGSYANDTMTLLNPNQYSFNALFAVGNYNATNFYCADGSNNIARDLSNFTFAVTSPPSVSGGGGGGGGGGIVTQTIIQNVTFPIANCNFNKICEFGEDFLGCREDCRTVDRLRTDYIFCDDPTKPCITDDIKAIFASRNPVLRISIIAIPILIAVVFLPKESKLGKLFKVPLLKSLKRGK